MTDIVRSENSQSKYILRSHILHPHDELTTICMVRAPKENVLSVIEDHLLESLSSTDWQEGQEEWDFAFVTEKYNHFLKNLAEEDREDIHVLFAIIKKNHLIVSTIGDMYPIIHERNGSTKMIYESITGSHFFDSYSSGDIPRWGYVFFTSRNLDGIISEDFYEDSSILESEKFEETTLSLLEHETTESIHIIRISLKESPKANKKRGSSQADIIKNASYKVIWDIWKNIALSGIHEKIGHHIAKKWRAFTAWFFVIWIIIFFSLLSYILSALFSVTSSPLNDSKTNLLKAKTLIEESQKLTSNPQAFHDTIKEAETLLLKLREEKQYMKDTENLLTRVEAMKKEIYDIQSIDLKKKESLVKFNPLDISPIWLFESSKKLNLIGKNGAILWYAPWNPLPKVTSYPTWEEWIDFTSTEDWSFYILTKNNRVLASRKNNEVTYVNVMWQDTWENADMIKSYNDNIYLLWKKDGQLYKHRPGLNGFSQKAAVFQTALSWVLDVGVDWGFYVIKGDHTVSRILTAKTYSSNGIILNKIPGEYKLWDSGDISFITNKNIKYVYILDNRRIWIFEPDAKNFQDVKSWTYIAQLEIDTSEEVRNISVPRDGQIYVITNLWVYNITFEVVDQNLVLR